MLSERSRMQWDTYPAASRAQAAPLGDRDELRPPVVGVHLRREQLTAPQLGQLLDKDSGDAAERHFIGTFVANGRALPASYGRIVGLEEGAYVYGDGVFEA